MTASNQTYSFLSGRSRQPSSGTGMPQSMSLVMARGRRSSSRFSENFNTLGRQSFRVLSQSPSAEANAGRSRKRCSVSTNVGLLAVDPRPGFDQVDRVELIAAVVALVAPRAGIPADRAGALDIAVGKGAAGGRRNGRHRDLRHEIAIPEHRAEHFLDDRVVIAGGGPGEQVVGQAEIGEVLDDDPVVAVGQRLRRHALLHRPAPGSGCRARRSRRPSARRCRPSAGSGRTRRTGRRSRTRGRCGGARWRRARRQR